MTLKKFALIPLLIGVLACLIQVADQLIVPMLRPDLAAAGQGFSWISFISWATYFLAGCTVRGGVKTFFSYVIGIGASIVIVLLATNFAGTLGFWATPIAVGIVAFSVIFLERVDILSLIPALFIAAGTFFGFMNFVPGATFSNAYLTIMIYGVLGMLFGWITVTLRGKYESCAMKS